MDEKYRKEIRLGRYKLSYYQKGKGPVLLLLHGALNSARSFRHVFKTLALTSRVVVPDLPGAGFSSKSIKFDFSLDSLADLLGQFLTELKIRKTVLAGASSGGALAQKIVLKFPEKVEKLILIDSLGMKSGKNKPAFDLPAGKKLLAELSNPASLMKFYLNQFRSEEAVGMEERMKYLDLMLKKSVPECSHKFLQVNRNFEIEEMTEINRPTLIVWGERDKVLPKKTADKFVKKIPDSRYVMIPEAGHLPHEESPEDFVTVVLDFLKGGIPHHN